MSVARRLVSVQDGTGLVMDHINAVNKDKNNSDYGPFYSLEMLGTFFDQIRSRIAVEIEIIILC